MPVASSPVGYLPFALLGLVLAALVVVAVRRWRGQRAGALPSADSPADSTQEPPQQRRRILTASELERTSASTADDDQGQSGIAPEPAPAPVLETVTAVLRRRVPPCDGGQPASWLGGLPEMPAEVAWPRSISAEHPGRGERPLHFLAQICCADLPANLWGGLGPRAGWLLFFIDPNQGCPDGVDALRVIHVAETGPMRQAPDDLGPVHDGTYCGGSYRWLPTALVPPVWRRWPVDIVNFPNTLRQQDGRSLAAPEDFAQQLYEGAPILPFRELRDFAPYSYGQALRAVNLLAARMRHEPREVASVHIRELLEEDGSIAALRGQLEARLTKALDRAGGDGQPYAHVEALRRCLALVTACQSPADLIARLETGRERHARWRGAVVADCARLAELLAAQPPETALALDDWRELQDCLKVREWRGFELRIEYPGDQPRYLDLAERAEQASLEAPAGITNEAMGDWYDPATRSRLPANRLAELEAAARSLRDNRPHRMGGYHDGLQSDAVQGPAETLLLLQIASDDAMDWCWGDSGTCYFWIEPAALAAGDFSQVRWVLECH